MKGILKMKYSDFKFIQPLLTKAHFDILNNFDGKPDMEVSINLKKNILRFTGQNKAVVSINIRLNQLENDKKRKNIPFIAEVEMQSIFTWKEDLNEEEINKFLNQNAVALILSYIRPIIATLTASSPLQTYNLPFIQITND